MGSIAVLILWFQLFYWMKLFERFSAFVRIISEIVIDIKVFFLMMLLVLCAFSNVMLILQLNRAGNDDMVVDPLVGILPIDAIIIAYMTGLGEYHTDGYS